AGDLGGLLDLYGQVRRGKQVSAGEANKLASLLRLSGIVRVREGKMQEAKGKSGGPDSGSLPFAFRLLPSSGTLAVRNRIYARVFDRDWIRQHMPDAELRRQRAAYRRGLLGATSVAGVVQSGIAGLAPSAGSHTRA